MTLISQQRILGMILIAANMNEFFERASKILAAKAVFCPLSCPALCKLNHDGSFCINFVAVGRCGDAAKGWGHQKLLYLVTIPNNTL